MSKLVVDSMVVGFALFAMFFGAGNIIFPPYVGYIAGTSWFEGFFFYYIADIGLALVAVFAMLRSQNIDTVEGIMYRLGKVPARIMMSAVVLCIGPLVAIPRTATVSFEMAVAPNMPFIGMPLFILAYFVLVWIFAIRESALVNIIGKFLTPLLVIGLLLMILLGVLNPIGPVRDSVMAQDSLIWDSVLAGYQTLDVLAALVFGLIVVNALKLKGYTSERSKFKSVGLASLVAGFLLLLIYGGLCYLGATMSTVYPVEDITKIDRAQMVILIARHLLGNSGVLVLGVVVLLACLTTAIALVGAAGTFFSTLSNGKLSYKLLVTSVCVFSVCVANLGLNTIISAAVPVLMIVYPAALVVVILSLFNTLISNDNVFKGAVLGALVISVCEALGGLGFVQYLPLQSLGFGWVVPAAIGGIIGAFIKSGNPAHVAK